MLVLLVQIYLIFYEKKTKYKLISIDDYSSGFIKIVSKINVLNICGNTKNINFIIKDPKTNSYNFFHFGEFSSLYQSFINMNECLISNIIALQSYLIFASI